MTLGHSHHRNAQSVVGEMVTGNVTITSTATELKAGVDILNGRTMVFVINDSSKVIELSTDPDLMIGGGNIIAFSGEVISFEVEPNPGAGIEPTRLYGIVEEGSTFIRVTEVK